jgi:hypothetical protein
VSVRLVTPDGTFVDIPDELADAAIARGFKPATAQQGQAFETTPERDTSTLGAAAAGVGSALSSATLGGSDVLADALFSRGDVAAMRKAREDHPIASTVGAVAGAFTGPGAGIGAKLTEGAEGLSAGRQIARAAGGYAAEGAVQGLGQGASEIALSDDPVSIERAASVLSSNMLFGGAVGGAAGTLGKSAELGLLRAKGAMDRIATRASTGSAIGEDLAQLDGKGLRAAKEAEVSRLLEAQKAERAAAVEEVGAYRAAVKEANPWLAINEGEEAALLGNAKKGLRNAFNDPRGLADDPRGLLKPLRVEEQAFERALANREAIAEKLGAANKKIATEIEETLSVEGGEETVRLTGKAAKRYSQFADVKVGKGGVSIARDDAEAFLDALKTGKVQGAGEQAFGKLEGLLEQNRALQAKIKASLTSKADLASEKLSAIADAEDMLKSGGGKKSLLEDALGGTIYGKAAGMMTGVPILGPIAGAKAARFVTDLVFGRLGKASGDLAKRSAAAVSSVVGVAAKGAKASPVIATKVLQGLRYAPSSSSPAPATTKPAKGKKAQQSLADSYLARAHEIRSQVELGPDGATYMRPAARAAMAAKLAPIRAMHPVLADRIETLAARRLEFLAPRLPTKPDPMGLQPGATDNWRPSDMEMRRAARLMAAVEDPHAVLDRIADGSITPEDAEAVKACYPELHAQVTQEIFSQLSAAKSLPPYQRRLALSIFTGRPVDPALHPVVLSALQQQFAREDGTEGGTQAPRAQPQFGSISKSLPEPTPAQKRAG